MNLDDAILPMLGTLRDQTPGVGREEVIVIPQVKPLGVPPGMVRRQPHRDVLTRLLRLAGLQHQVEAPGPHRLPHPYGSTGGVEELAPIQVEPQILVRHHLEVALTHCCENRHGSDGVRRKVLKLHNVVVEERPHKAAQRGTQAVAVKLGEGDDVPLGRPRFLVIRCRRNPLWPRRRNARAQKTFLLEL